MSDSEYSTDHSDISDSDSVPGSVGSNSIADATIDSQSASDDSDRYSDSEASQSFSDGSASSYQTDVTVSSDDSDNEDNDSASGRSYDSEGSGEYTPVEMSDNEIEEADPVYVDEPVQVSDDEHVQALEEEGPIQVSDDDEEDRPAGDASVVIVDVVPPAIAEIEIIEAPLAPQNEAVVPQAGPSMANGHTGPAKKPGSAAKTAKKRPASEMVSDDDDDDDQMCPICYDSWQGTGPHRIVSLKCGHLFGKSCVEKWVKSNKKCPKCNTANKMSDIRKIFAPTIKVKETEGEKRLQAELAKALAAQREAELKVLRKDQEIKALQEAQAAKANNTIAKRDNPSEKRTKNNKFSFKMVKDSQLRNSGGRVMAFCPWENQLVVSCASPMAGYHGIQVYDCERGYTVRSIDAFHTQPIRDMEYCPNQSNNILLTASLDKSVKLIDYRSNSVVHSYRTPMSAWSCCWDRTGACNGDIHKISIGLMNGEIARFDIRMPNVTPYMMLGKRVLNSGQDITGIHSLVTVPPNYNPSLPRGALIAAHLKSCQLFIGDEDVTGVQLPFQGNLTGLRAEPVTGHLLLSNKQAGHTVLRIRHDANAEPVELFEPILQLNGGGQAQTTLKRSAIATYTDGNNSKLLVVGSEESSRTVKLWSVSDGGSIIGNLTMSDVVMDVCNLKFNHKDFFAFLTDKKVSIYEMTVR
ncbi:E3 ubiquitin-protein ligase RFWD3-like [Neocloeon triangulifer]|uniref:E3 ubiquitin-protein ligase RFWD3-like n=1 Tax=Neocloeon triangulifer TaxID=2078957 RepID=UPI00286FA013|nr:E3 ubiquitin-protein ligase RFWD3-like [Neocloeon triangulifer]XP_059478040.1 E3 ubiquitin-protein ligase RFWD3-like [Neocloeon triangulifer]